MAGHHPIAAGWAATFFTLVACAALGDSHAEFDRAYTIYQKHIESGEWAEALVSAEEAYDLGIKAFGADAEQTISLGYDYGKLLNRFERYHEALPVLQSVVKTLTTRYGQESSKLTEPLLELGKATYDPDDERPSIRLFDRVVTLAAKGQPIDEAMADMDAGMFLSNTMDSPSAEPFLQAARERLGKLVGTNDIRTAIVSMQLAKWQLAREQYQAALNMLGKPLEVFVADPDPDADGLEVATRAFMVQALEHLGRHDEATAHCLVIGRMTGHYLPLVKVQPEYPPAALKQGRSGWVVVQFTVDSEGYVKDATVADSSSPVFQEAALAAARKFRYAPRFEDGRPVATPGVQNKITFDIVGNR